MIRKLNPMPQETTRTTRLNSVSFMFGPTAQEPVFEYAGDELAALKLTLAGILDTDFHNIRKIAPHPAGRRGQAILTDIHLPDESGDMILRTLRSDAGPNRETPGSPPGEILDGGRP